MATKLSPNGSRFPNPEAARAYVFKAIEDFAEHVLFVFDNYDRPGRFSNIKDFFPYRVSILCTSRHTDSKRLGNSVEVGPMPIPEGIELLLLQSGYEHTAENVKDAHSIVEKLGCLALAIDQAATYISTRLIPLDSFITLYAKRRAAILKHTAANWEYRRVRSSGAEEPLSVFTTWEMSFEELETSAEDRESLIHLLTISAFLDTAHISEGLFKHYYEVSEPKPAWLSSFLSDDIWDQDKYQDCIVRLLGVSIIQSIDIMSDDTRFSFHPLVAEWLKLRIDEHARRRFTEEAIQILRLYVDGGDTKEMPLREKSEVLSHLNKAVENDHMYHAGGKHVSHTLMSAMISFGSFYRRLGRHRETGDLIERAINEQPDEITPAIQNVLANMYNDLGELQKSEASYNQLYIKLGKTPPGQITSETPISTVLGLQFYTQDDKLDATGMHYEGTHLGEFGTHEAWFVSTLSALNGLGIVHLKKGLVQSAEILLTQALAGREETSGALDKYTLNVVDHLASVFLLQGDLDKAERFYQRALTGLEKCAGPNGMVTQQTVNNIALLYYSQGRLEEAEQMLRRALRTLEAGRGSAHASTIATFHNLGLLFMKKGDLVEAGQFFLRALEGWEISGIAKPEADTTFCLAQVREGEDDLGKAETLFREAAKLYGHALGENHRQTLEAMRKADQVGNVYNIGKLSM